MRSESRPLAQPLHVVDPAQRREFLVRARLFLMEPGRFSRRPDQEPHRLRSLHGATPDVKVPAAEALDTAKKMALDEIRKKAPQKK